MDSYAHRRGTQNAAVKDIAGLEDLKNRAVFFLGCLRTIDCLMEVRVEWLAYRVGALRSQLGDVLQKLFVDQLETFAIAFIFSFAMRRQSVLKPIYDRDETFNHSCRSALGILEPFLFDALAVVRKIRLAAQHCLAQLFQVRG